MEKNYEYFAEFLNDPAPYSASEFVEKLSAWADYVRTHGEEINYFEAEEWREIRERVSAEYWRREKIREEFDELNVQLEAIDLIVDDNQAIEIMSRFISFMKKYRHIYEFSDEQLAEIDERREKFVQSVSEWEVAEENARLLKIKEEKALEDLDNAISEHYEQTGKRPILANLPSVKKHMGN